MSGTAPFLPRETIRQLSRRSNLWGAWLVFHCWASIIAAGALFAIWPNIFTFILAVMLIGSRQLGLAILMHDAAHGALFSNRRLNDIVGHYMLAIPFGGDMHAYRRYHLQHHRHAQRPEDPDLALSNKFPVTRASLIRKFLRDIVGWTAVRTILAVRKQRSDAAMASNTNFKAKTPTRWPYWTFNLGLLGILSAFGLWWAYFALWLLPLFTWFQVVLRLRNIAEHAMTTFDDNPLTHARTTQANILERIFIAPYWVNYHVEHHVYMFVPCHKLKVLHREMERCGHTAKMTLESGYFNVLKRVVTV